MLATNMRTPCVMHWQKAKIFLRTYILNNLIHQLHMFLLHCISSCTDSWSNHWSGIQDTRAGCQDTCVTAAWMSLKVGIADFLPGKTGEGLKNYFQEVIEEKEKMYICCWIWSCGDVSLFILGWNHFQEKYISWKKNLRLWFTNLRIRISIFRNVSVNAADHLTKSDLNSKFKMAAMIMTWFLR